MNTYKWPHASLSLTSAWSALGNPKGVEQSAHTTSRSHSAAPFNNSGYGAAVLGRDDEHCPVCYASRHAESFHVVAPGHNEGLDARYGGEVPV